MKWITRTKMHVGRVSCPWLIKRFVYPSAEIIFAVRNIIPVLAEKEGSIPFDTSGFKLINKDLFIRYSL